MNNLHKKNKQNLLHPQKCNDFNDPSLLEAEETIKKAKFDSQPASNDFRESLKQKILDRRHKKNYMQNALKSVSRFFTVRRLAPVLSFVVIVGILVTTVHYWPGEQNSPFGNFQKLIINSAYAMDNFEVTATDSDSAGIDNDSSFIIKSREALDPEILRANITLSPDVEFDFKAKSDKEFQITPKGDLSPKTVYNVIITASFASANGLSLIQKNYSWAFQVKDDFQILGTLPRDKGSNVPVNSGIEIIFSHANFENYENKFTIEPSVEGNFEVHDQTLVFIPKSLLPGTIYKATIKEGIELNGSDKELESDYTFEFETAPKNQPVRGATFNFTDYYNYFGANDEPVLQFYSYDLETTDLDVTVYRFNDEETFLSGLKARGEIPYWANYNRDNFAFDRSSLEQYAQFTLNGFKSNYRKYLSLPQQFPLGYYFVEVKKGDVSAVSLMNISNISTYTSITETKTLFWLNDIVTKQPVANARVDSINNNGSTRTDNNGVATLDTAEFAEGDDSTYYFRVQNNGDSSIVQINAYQYSPLYRFGEKTNGNDDYWLYFYADKPVYQPTDTINFWGFIKDRDDIGIKEEVKVRLSKGSNYYFYSNPSYYGETTIDFDGNAYSGTMDINNLVPGYYSLEVWLGDKSLTNLGFYIQNYTKPAYTIETKAEKRAYFDGDQATFDTVVKFYDGTPMSGLDLSYDYASGQKGKLKTNKSGIAQVTVPANYDRPCRGSNCVFSEDSASINVLPDLGEDAEISARSTIRIFNSKVDINENSFKRIDDNMVKVEGKVNAVDLDKYNNEQGNDFLGKPKSGQKIIGEITETEYVQVETGEEYDFINKRTYKTYRTERVVTTIDNFELQTDPDGSFSHDLNIQKNKKSYVVHLKTFDSNGKENSTRNFLYDSRGNFSGIKHYEILDERALTEEYFDIKYKLDENVNLVYVGPDNSRPEGDTQKYLFVKLQKGLLDYSVLSTNKYNFTFKKEHVPNVYVSGIFFDGRTYHEANDSFWMGGGGYNAIYDYSEKELDIEIVTDKKEYKPGEDVTASVSVKDSEGRAVDVDVNLNIIDEAIYSISSDYAYPLTSLYRNLSTGKISSGSTHKEMALGLDGGAEGGGCFASGTKILMADKSHTNIEDIKVGDRILTFASETDRRLVEGTVKNTVEHLVGGYLLVNDYLKVTPEHRVFLNNSWTVAGLAKPGDYFLNKKGEYVKIETIEPIYGDVKVYNFEVEDYHTYFADDLYVHNDKGGASLRKVFEDSALFFTARTGNDGKAEVKFTLPDNLTSWRLTGQALSGSELSAGVGIINIPVSLPAFVKTVIANDYLVSDKPIVKATAYGKDLNNEDEVELTLNSDSLDIDDLEVNTTAFTPAYFDLGDLSEGTHDLRFDLDSSAGEDAMLQRVAVNRSRLMVGQEDFYELKQGLNITGIEDGYATLTFSDENQGKFYNELLGLSYAYGDRVDQQLARVVSRDILGKHFDKEYFTKETIASASYQTYEGAITILPYSNSDFELTAKVAATTPYKFDQTSLKKYFYKILNNDLTNQSPNKTMVAYALYGLAGLGEPVLLQIQNVANFDELSTQDKLVIGLAAYEIGDQSLAQSMFNEVMDKSSENLEPMIRINEGNDDKKLKLTILSAILGAGISDERHNELWNYVDKYYTEDILIYIEKLNYMQNVMKSLSPEPVSFEVKIGGKKYSEELEHGRTFKITASAEDIRNLEVNEFSGQVGLVVNHEVPVTNANNNPDESISISREYFVNGQKTNKLKENDIVEVRIYPKIDETALQGYYHIVDFLPSGIKPMTQVDTYFRKEGGSGYKLYPTAINGQTVKATVHKKHLKSYYYYRARVVTTGTYTAEPMLIQSLDSKALKNWSTSSQIVIEQ
jgi:hypothetical protein